jgi:hypothetical protein
MSAFTIKDIQAILKALRYDDRTTRHKTLIDSGNKNKLTIIGENQMDEIATICPVCEEDITISEREIRLAIQHKQDTGGNVLVSCPNCCRVLVMPVNMPEGAELEQWITNVEDVVCVPILNDDYIRLPTGKTVLLGKTTYMSGGGDAALMKRPYMFRYGINPECALAKNPSEGKKPFVIGGKQ